MSKMSKGDGPFYSFCACYLIRDDQQERDQRTSAYKILRFAQIP